MADPALVAVANQAQDILSQDLLGGWIDTYRGGVPRGFAGVIVVHESGGNFASPGDPSLGEVGYFQVAAYVPQMFGMDVSATQDPETNVCVGLLEYQYEAVLWNLFSGGLVSLGSGDSYRLARLTFAIGRGGARALAMSAGMRTSDDVYGDISRYVAANGAPSLGGVSAAKVGQRTLDIANQWNSADLVQGGNSPGGPTLVPQPPMGPYTIPADAAPYFSEPIGGSAILLGAAIGLGAYLLASRSRRR
jgi:hypothetical protein